MKLSQYAADNTANSVNASFGSVFDALKGVGKFDIVTGVTGAAGAAFSVSHKLGRKPEFFWALPESACVFTWTADDKRFSGDKVLVAHASAAAVPFVAAVFSRFE